MTELKKAQDLLIQARAEITNYVYGIRPGKEIPSVDEASSLRQIIEDIEALEYELSDFIEEPRKPHLRIVK